MCGIVGIINPYKSFHFRINDAFTEMLYADALRGKDSTGVFTVKANTVDWIKAAVPPWKFFAMEKVPEFLRSVDRGEFVVGHNRAASKGSVSNKNAHPFQVKHICGVHNGTLWSTHDLDVDKTIEVDSEMVFTAIAKEGITKVSPKLRGSYSLVWYNQETKNLNFLRNKERPMFFLWTKNPDLMFFGSELGLLEWAAKRNKYEIVSTMETQPNVVYKFKEGATKPTVLKVKEYEFKSYTGGYHSWPHQNNLPYNDGESNIVDAEVVNDVPEEVSAPKAVPHSVAKVFPFPVARTPANVPRPPKDPNYRNWLVALANQWKKGSFIEFSVHDWSDRCQGGFLPVVGKHPRWPDEVFIKGNYTGTEEALVATKCLMRGQITQISVLKHKSQVLIQVKAVHHTENVDPLQDKKAPLVEAGYSGMWICSDCGYRKTPPEKPFIREVEGITEFLCKKCLEEEAKDCTKEGGCHCDVEKEYCVYYVDGDAAVCKEVGREERQGPTIQ